MKRDNKSQRKTMYESPCLESNLNSNCFVLFLRDTIGEIWMLIGYLMLLKIISDFYVQWWYRNAILETFAFYLKFASK